MPTDWTDQEVAATVADYFEMLGCELRGEPYNKAEHNRRLLPQLVGRSRGAIEFKHCNISAVLIRLGLPYISGYQPRSNYQAKLVESVRVYLDAHLRTVEAMAEAPLLNPTLAPVIEAASVDGYFDTPPDEMHLPPDADEPWRSRRGRRLNIAERESRNRKLGNLGERFVVDLERRRLEASGRDDLSSRVDWVADTCGDGLGFDVLSFDERSGDERLLEVKTTTQGKHFPFYLTKNEVRCSQSMPEQFRLYRVFQFGERPRLYVVDGDLTERLRLDPIQFRAAI